MKPFNELTQNQKDFFYNNVFCIKDNTYAGAKNIAEELMSTGQCVVAGQERIWVGGVGNFISISKAPGTVNCSFYTLDKENMFKSAWFNLILMECLARTSTIKEQVDAKYNDMLDLIYEKNKPF